jgi:hypothetical protein
MEMEMSKLLRLRLIGGLIAAGALGACYHTHTASGVVYVRTGPPADRVEVISTSPGTRYVWVGGHWAWVNSDYDWVSGSWVLPAASFTTWVPGHWAHDGNGWFWIDGHWR